jgi:hypothetical protein
MQNVLCQFQLNGLVFHCRRLFAQLVRDFPGGDFTIAFSQILQLSSRPAGDLTPAYTHFAELLLNRDERAFELSRQRHCALGRVPFLQKRQFRFRIRPLNVWFLCDFCSLPVKVLLRFYPAPPELAPEFTNFQLKILKSGPPWGEVSPSSVTMADKNPELRHFIICNRESQPLSGKNI